jgi:hypothetical protein
LPADIVIDDEAKRDEYWWRDMHVKLSAGKPYGEKIVDA